MISCYLKVGSITRGAQISQCTKTKDRDKVANHQSEDEDYDPEADEVAGLLSGFLGSLGANYSQFPICEESWKNVNKAKKEHAYDIIKEAITNIVSQDESSKNLSQNDLLAQVLGKEHPGRVRALGAEPCPTQVFGNAHAQLSGSGVLTEEYHRTIAKLKAEVAEEKAKRQLTKKLLGYLIRQQETICPLTLLKSWIIWVVP
ncbi:hypothetical protein Ahy_A03g014806 [Arachis hypogaea]|uniref:Uncharacterized protein n=1 Tax=Arachis hypogaea TaxID=3818 RepID=A0A445DYS1_ARAHY|nr:hypothetical protein Ahy_A03g014806 [Arachis hypogaea]